MLRYRTSRGWVSELTRSQDRHVARESITEILDVTVGEDGMEPSSLEGEIADDPKRVECGVPDLRSVGASVLARLHGSQVRMGTRDVGYVNCFILWLVPLLTLFGVFSFICSQVYLPAFRK